MTAIFDLELTLINGDSSTFWCHWLCDNGYVNDVPKFKEREAELMVHYREKRLNVADYITLALSPIIDRPITEIDQLLELYIEEKITPIIIPTMLKRLQDRQKERETIIISSSPYFLVEAIAKKCFNVADSFGVTVRKKGDFYTTEVIGISPYQGGKLTIFQEFINSTDSFFEDTYFYTDSINDIALLEAVEFPMIINPDKELLAITQKNGWTIIND